MRPCLLGCMTAARRRWLRELGDPDIRLRSHRGHARGASEGLGELVPSGGRRRHASVGGQAPCPQAADRQDHCAQITRRAASSPEDAIIDLVIEDDASAGAAYTIITEDNIPRQLALPWVSSGSDAESSAPEGVFLLSSTHPRAYGNFARLFAKYMREEHVLSVEEAVRRLTSLPADVLSLAKSRGRLRKGAFADVRDFRPENYSRPFHVPKADAVRHRRHGCLGERQARVEGRGTDRNTQRTCAARTRLDRRPGRRVPRVSQGLDLDRSAAEALAVAPWALDSGPQY